MMLLMLMPLAPEYVALKSFFFFSKRESLLTPTDPSQEQEQQEKNGVLKSQGVASPDRRTDRRTNGQTDGIELELTAVAAEMG